MSVVDFLDIDNDLKESMYFYLDLIQDHGETNMYGVAPYLAKEFHISKYEARKVLAAWMTDFNNKVS